MSFDKYILNDKGEPIVEEDLMKWAKWFQTGKRSVADDTFNGIRVSTIFLGLDHNYSSKGPPVYLQKRILML